MNGLYLHIPFCSRKCPYCDFFSLVGDDRQLADYVALLQRELGLYAGSGMGPFETLFFGGGTPSRLTPEQVADLLSSISQLFGLTPGAELTLEANPGTLDAIRLAGYRRAGINRLSLGVQSFDDRMLTVLGRSHSAAQARKAFTDARRVGFDNLSCDLIFALPDQQLADLDREIDALLALGPEHISAYALTLEEGTPFHLRHQQQPLALPDDEQGAAFFLHLDARLSSAGYRHYEISNYALPGHECRHNLATWHRQGYLGIGAGAHSFDPAEFGSRRANPADLAVWRAALETGRNPAETLERFDRRGAMCETLYLGLRTAEGVDARRFRSRFGTPLEEVFGNARRRCAEHLLVEPDRWRFTPQGWLLYDHLIQHFLA